MKLFHVSYQMTFDEFCYASVSEINKRGREGNG